MDGPRVSFYVLPGRDERARRLVACRLVEKAWLAEHRVHVLLEDAAAAREFDELLWLFSDIGFVPHALAGDPAARDAAVLIGTPSEPGAGAVLVNLCAALPEAPERYERIVEVIDADEERRRQGRERFRAYRDRGILPQTHNLGDA